VGSGFGRSGVTVSVVLPLQLLLGSILFYVVGLGERERVETKEGHVQQWDKRQILSSQNRV